MRVLLPRLIRYSLPPRSPVILSTSAILNLCMPYAARNEIATAVDLAIDSALSTETADGTHP